MSKSKGIIGKPFTKGDKRASECGKKSKRPSLDARLRERLEKDGKLDSLMEVLEALALGGDLQAIKELLDRTYGKARQNIELGNASEDGLRINIIKNYDEPDKPNE